MRLKHILLYIILLSGFCRTFAADIHEVDYGLIFRSHGFNLDERTGLNLSADGNFNFRKGFSMDFDMRLDYGEDALYGYVFRIIAGNSSIDLVSNAVTGHFNLLFSNGQHVVEKIDFPALPTGSGKLWHHVCITVSPAGLSCSIDDTEEKIDDAAPDLRNVDIRFGWNDHPVFYTTDVLSVSIREIVLSDEKGPKYHWQLFQHNKNEVYDLLQGRRAQVYNGVWAIDSHCEWKDVLGMRVTSGAPLIACDSETSRLFVATEDSLFVCSLADGAVTDAVKVSGKPVMHSGNQMVYDRDADCLVCYSMHGNELAFYDFATSSWTGSFDEPWPPLVGHCKWLDQSSGRLYIFGGYGNHRYYADFTEIDLVTSERTVVSLADEVYPRYFGAMCPDGDGNLIVLGGFGNISGLQEECPGALNDIFRIDCRSGQCDSIASFSWTEGQMIFASSMVLDRRQGDLYALAFSNNRFKSSLNLVSCSLEGDGLVYHSSPVNFNFHDMDSYVELVFNRDSSMFYAVVLNTRISGANDLKVYSLAYPPVSMDEIMQVPEPKFHAVCMVLAILVLLVALACGYLIYRRRHPVMGPVKTELTESSEELLQAVPVADEVYADGHGMEHNISLLGGLKIYDRDGNDATSKLSPMLRSLFLFALMRTCGSRKAVTAEELNEVFWFGMEKSVASNNRNVNMRKLRVVLQEIGDIQIVFSNDIFKMTFGEDVRCDYIELMQLLHDADDADTVGPGALAAILGLAVRGNLLSGYEYEWLDSYKSEYSELLIRVMMKAAREPAVSSNSGYMLGIADCILREDRLDEFAIRVKCSIFYRRGHKGLSRQVYDKWCTDYRRLMDSEPEISYKNMTDLYKNH
ncbi:MAG: hypothetical protein NC115_03985 [Bacteroidales bacterium]|nr:hypothetical protein [Bacteroides sp.]MCM1197769.1 hypothetical protein [Clostridium sp.]MCM1501811.1 hypothetical protein [Bacteroidales bacterium]